MSNIKFVSHHTFPEDPYTRELVYLCIDDKYRVAYVRKNAKNGGMYWAVPSVAATLHGSKEYFEAFMYDSSFLQKDVKAFLDERPWEKMSKAPSQISDDVPF